MDKIVIEGGDRLEGELSISGAKNAALPAIAATLLCPGRFVLSNVPRLRDIDTINSLLTSLGAEVKWEGENSLSIDTEKLNGMEAPYDLVRTMRASCLVLGPLIARVGEARISMPGGCAIGERPIDLHLKGFESLGAKILFDHGYVDAVVNGGLHGARIAFDIVTVTGTANVMMAATAAKGTTILENSAREPEIVFLADMLNAMGARIEGAGTDKITITGGNELRPVEMKIIPDRIETGTFIAAAAINGGNLRLNGCNPAHLEAVTVKFIELGCRIVEGNGFMEVIGPKRVQPADVETSPYPAFPTDMQAQIMAALAVADGTSLITETVFENRFMHVAELRRMGAKIKHVHNNAFITGVKSLYGADVMATDLRASASLILAGLAANGRTEVRRVYHLDRGYQGIERKLKKVGAKISRTKDA